jgi:hypothetical protein
VFLGGVEVAVQRLDWRTLTGTIPASVTGPTHVTVQNPDESSRTTDAPCDVDFDGDVDVRDVLLAVRAVKGELELSWPQAENADVAPGTPDGRVDAGDLLLIERASRGEAVPACGAP